MSFHSCHSNALCVDCIERKKALLATKDFQTGDSHELAICDNLKYTWERFLTYAATNWSHANSDLFLIDILQSRTRFLGISE